MRKFVLLSLLVVCLSSFASATAISASQWYEFGFGSAGTLGGDCTGCVAGVLSVNAGTAPWTYTAGASGAVLTVVDGFLAGDAFDPEDFGTSLGVTSEPGEGDCGNDEVACLANPNMSSGFYFLAGGSHSITIRVTDSPFGGGAAFFRVDERDPGNQVPEPATLILLGSGLAGLFLRKRSA